MTIGYDIKVSGLDEQLAKLAKFDDINNRHLRKAMQQSLLTIGSNVIPLVPVGVSGRLRNSMGSEIQGINGSLVGRFGSSLKDEIYPQTMEFGRRPGTFPPVEALLRWVHLKVKPVSPDPEWQDEYEYWVALQIARKIKANGIKGREFMKQGFEKSKAAVIGYFNQALERIAKDLENGR